MIRHGNISNKFKSALVFSPSLTPSLPQKNTDPSPQLCERKKDFISLLTLFISDHFTWKYSQTHSAVIVFKLCVW